MNGTSKMGFAILWHTRIRATCSQIRKTRTTDSVIEHHLSWALKEAQVLEQLSAWSFCRDWIVISKHKEQIKVAQTTLALGFPVLWVFPITTLCANGKKVKYLLQLNCWTVSRQLLQGTECFLALEEIRSLFPEMVTSSLLLFSVFVVPYPQTENHVLLVTT